MLKVLSSAAVQMVGSPPPYTMSRVSTGWPAPVPMEGNHGVGWVDLPPEVAQLSQRDHATHQGRHLGPQPGTQRDWRSTPAASGIIALGVAARQPYSIGSGFTQ